MIARLPVQVNPVTSPAISQRSRFLTPRKARRRRDRGAFVHQAVARPDCLACGLMPVRRSSAGVCYVVRRPHADHPKPTTRPHAQLPRRQSLRQWQGRPRLSLVVLPFINLGGENMDDATVDALTEDLTSDLARVYDLFVIGRSSAFSYKGKPIDIKRVGEELGVRYVVEGSVRKLNGTLRVNVQLVSAETGSQVWSDHFGVERDGVGFGVDDLVRQIAHVLNDRVIDSESIRSARERPANPDVTDICCVPVRWRTYRRTRNSVPDNGALRARRGARSIVCHGPGGTWL